jgi:spore maturation protein CgeB
MKIEDKYWGNKSNAFLTHQTLNDIYNKSKILLLFGIYADDINHYSEKELEDIDGTPGRSGAYPCRIFSYAGSGSLVLADKRKEGDRHFLEDNEFVVYNSVKECIEKIEYYLLHEQEREEIADKGYKRYLKDHTIEIRMKKILEAVNG